MKDALNIVLDTTKGPNARVAALAEVITYFFNYVLSVLGIEAE